MQTPNSGTPHSQLGLHLRTEPMARTLPPTVLILQQVGDGQRLSLQPLGALEAPQIDDAGLTGSTHNYFRMHYGGPPRGVRTTSGSPRSGPFAAVMER